MNQNYRHLRRILLAATLAAGVALPKFGVRQAIASDAKGDLAPLPLKLPVPTSKGTPDNLPEGPHVEKFSDKPRPPFMAPKGVKNVALGKKVTCSIEKL